MKQNETFNCPICNKETKRFLGVVQHMIRTHGISIDDAGELLMYIHPYLYKNCSYCGKLFNSPKSRGGKLCCSEECSSLAKERLRQSKIGKKQSEEQIRKRIENTDQSKKTEKRRITMLDRYGSMFFCKDEEDRNLKISNSHKGKKHSKEHHEKVIDSKRRNGKLNHSEDTKKRISETLLKYNQDGDSQAVFISRNPNNGRGHTSGFIDDILFRSSYEELFILFCKKHKIQIVSAEGKDYRVRYITKSTGKKHWYYPDFYLPEYNIIVEVKPKSMIKFNLDKFEAAMLQFEHFVVIDEDDLVDLSVFLEYLGELKNEHLLS